jgi:hypothetical protein
MVNSLALPILSSTTSFGVVCASEWVEGPALHRANRRPVSLVNPSDKPPGMPGAGH